MADSNATGSPLEAAASTSGERAVEAFSLLGDETRLAILLALWEAYEPFSESNTVPFSELRERVGMRDSGQFNYHLDKIEGHFVRKMEDGYELRRAGLQLVQTVIAGAGIDEPSLEPTEIDQTCRICGAPTAILYQDEWLYRICTECEGLYEERHDRPRGILSGTAFTPAGLTNRTPEDAWGAAYTTIHQNVQSAIEGICDTCFAPMGSSLDICDDHAPDGMCDNCGRHLAIMARFYCPVCKTHHVGPPSTMVIYHPAVIAFYYDHGIPFQYKVDDYESVQRRTNLLENHEQKLVSDDPVRVRVTIQYEGDELRLTIDDELDVIEVSRPD